jgi:primase-polymerase (primpol)-like protein
VVWRYVWRDDLQKWDEPPLQAHSLTAASSTKRDTWASFHEAMERYGQGQLDGIGRVVTEHNELVGVDLDHCRDPETGAIAKWAMTIVRALDSYTEVSPSGRGLRLWLKRRVAAKADVMATLKSIAGNAISRRRAAICGALQRRSSSGRRN